MSDDKPRIHRVDDHGIVHAVPQGTLYNVPSKNCIGAAGRWDGKVSSDTVPTCLLCLGTDWSRTR